MQKQTINQQFREDEVVIIKRWDKARHEYVANAHPKIGGRLRLAHDENENMSIETEIYRYDENIAVVSASCTTSKGCFKGIGMASVQRDQKIAPAILELAETRAIARSLRFAGYGVEYCSAEEVSHLEKGNGNRSVENQQPYYKGENSNNGGNGNNSRIPDNGNSDGNGNRTQRHTASNGDGKSYNDNGGRNQSGNGGSNGNGNGKGRLSSRQYQYIMNLNSQKGRTREQLDNKCVEAFGTAVQYLSKSDASSVIEYLINL